MGLVQGMLGCKSTVWLAVVGTCTLGHASRTASIGKMTLHVSSIQGSTDADAV